jgi:hypothetical protein
VGGPLRVSFNSEDGGRCRGVRVVDRAGVVKEAADRLVVRAIVDEKFGFRGERGDDQDVVSKENAVGGVG